MNSTIVSNMEEHLNLHSPRVSDNSAAWNRFSVGVRTFRALCTIPALVQDLARSRTVGSRTNNTIVSDVSISMSPSFRGAGVTEAEGSNIALVGRIFTVGILPHCMTASSIMDCFNAPSHFGRQDEVEEAFPWRLLAF